MSLPTPYTVLHEVYVAGVKDAHGNPVAQWAPPVLLSVHGWAPPTGDREPVEGNRNAVIRDLDVYAPAGTVVAPKDRITINGDRFEVVGHPEDYSHGPWRWQAGVRINLLRVEG